MPTISIIVPIYNVERYLNKCIDSILAQTFTDFELILVDDGSPDKCGIICDEYSRRDDRVRVIHKKNGGLSDARNVGIKISQGNYIGFVDSDDWIEPNMYEILYNLCVNNKADISTCLTYIWENDELKKTGDFSGEVNIYNNLEAIKNLYENKLSGFSVWNKLFSKGLFKDILFPKGRVYEDASIIYKLYKNANSIIFMKKPLYNYLRRENSISNVFFSEQRFDLIPMYDEMCNYMKEYYPEMSSYVNKIYYSSLRNMIVDIINEKRVFRNYRYICRISTIVKRNRVEIFNNKLISKKHRLLAHVLSFYPLLAVVVYKIKGCK